jgi:probable addiction module antidote protein
MNDDDPNPLRDNPARVAAHLNQAFATDDFMIILSALGKAMRAQNVSALSRATGLRRDRLYKTFGGDIEPDFRRVLRLLEGLDVQVTITPREVRKSKPPLPKLGRPRKRPSLE